MKRLNVRGFAGPPLATFLCAAALYGCDKKAPEPQARAGGDEVSADAKGPIHERTQAEPSTGVGIEKVEAGATAGERDVEDAGEPKARDGDEPATTEGADAPVDEGGDPDEDGNDNGDEDAKEALVADWAPFDASKLQYLASEGGDFHSNIEDKGPRLATITYPDGDVANAFAEQHEGSGTVMLSPEQIKTLGLKKPKAVWMFGPEGPCKAKPKRAYATVVFEASTVIETGFFLKGCTSDYAPVAYVGKKPPPAKWNGATRTMDDIVKNPKAFKHPARKQLVELGLLDNRHSETNKTAVTHVRITEAGPVTEFGVMQHWPHPEDCEEEQSGGVTPALWDHKSPPQWLRVGDEYQDPELVGTLTLDGKVAAIIFEESFNMYIQTQSAYTEVLTGDYHDEDVAYWGWSVLDGYCGP